MIRLEVLGQERDCALVRCFTNKRGAGVQVIKRPYIITLHL